MLAGDLEMFEYALMHSNKQGDINSYMEYLTSGKFRNEVIFNFSKNLKQRLQKDLITSHN